MPIQVLDRNVFNYGRLQKAGIFATNQPLSITRPSPATCVSLQHYHHHLTLRLAPISYKFLAPPPLVSSNKLQIRETHIDYRNGTNDPRRVVAPKANDKSTGVTFDVIYRYSRAYVLKGTVLSIISISLLAVKKLTDFTPSFFLGVLQAVIGGCLANLYVVGLNQLSDIEIDKVNKPYLPLASGELSVKNGLRITSLYAILGFCLGWNINSWHLKLCLFIWYAGGTAYSIRLPFLRWKQHPQLVSILSGSIQGVIFPMLFHLHAQTCIQGRPLEVSNHAIFVFGIMGIHSMTMTMFKDIPDVEGDTMEGIKSFASKFGQKKMFWICVWLIEIIYAIATIIGLSSTHIWIRYIMVIGHGGLGLMLWKKANLVDLKNNDAIELFYLFLWKLYYVEYLLVPILRF